VTLAAGSRLGPYEIAGKLGAGGMGEVFRARDTRLDRDVAIKVLPEEFFEEKERRERFVREAKLLAAVNHPNIATIHSFEEIAGRYLLVQELVEGETLSARLAGGAIPPGDVLRLGHQLADALAHAHEHGVIHRDFKSANVIITPEGRAKVLDFGLAKRSSEKELDEATTLSRAPLTEVGTAVGTPAYMAPEQLRGEAADTRSDVWALGVVLYEMAAGRRPFLGNTGFELSSAILSRAPEPLPSELSPALRVVIERCLAKDPGGRYERGSEVRAALDVVLLGSDSARRSPSPSAGRQRHRPGRKRIRGLVVLPLANLSGDPGQEYFADGMTEALISYLARIKALRVISRTSAMRYKATAKSVPEIAGELEVDAVVEGSVHCAGERVRIAARLVRAATDTQVWGESYERDLKDVLFLQSDVAQAIAREIRVAVTPGEAKQLASARPVNPEAYEACLKGRYHWYKLSREHLDRAFDYFQIALEKDPGSALAWAGIEGVWASRTDAGFIPPEEAIPKAKAAAMKALELDDSLADVHVMLGNLRFAADWDWSGAESAFRRAIEINPGSVDVHFFYSDFLISLGRPSDATKEMERALELDPLSSFLRCFHGWHLVYLHRADEAIGELQRALKMEPDFSSAYLGLWGAHYRKGDLGKAREAACRFFEVLGDHQIAEALSDTGGTAAYAERMRIAAERLEARSVESHVPAYRIARLFAHAGEKERALDFLEKAYADRESPLVHLRIGWDWDGLRDEPRFRSLLRRMNLPGR
jgi:serine/threonine protein kinase/tetratricopeptide (TPR) repeat protein